MTTMQDFTARLAGVFMLTLAAVPLAAGAASVAQAAPVAIRVADLDLKSASGQAAFAHRADRVAREICADARAGHLRDVACEAAVKREAVEKLAQVQQARALRASL
jgi:UrcA family protein